MLGRHLVLMIMLFLAINTASFRLVSAEVVAPRPLVVAIICLNEGGHQALTETNLQHALAARGLSVVDRETLRHVMDEHAIQLSSDTTTSEALRLGELITADALVILESARGEEGKPLQRARVVVTKTGLVRWEEIVVPTVPGETKAMEETIVESLTSRDALQARHVVAVLGFESEEEQDPELDRIASTLSIFAQTDLVRTPGVVVTERERLALLGREHQLGHPQTAWTMSAFYLSASVRWQHPRPGLQIVLRVDQVGSPGQTAIRTLTAPGGDLQRCRQAITDALGEMIRERGTLPEIKTPQAEATRLLRRANWLLAVGRHEEATWWAEAAICLQPSIDNLRKAGNAYWHLAHDLSKRPETRPTSDGILLAAAIREIDIRQQIFLATPASKRTCHIGLVAIPEANVREPQNPQIKEMIRTLYQRREDLLRTCYRELQLSNRPTDLLFGELTTEVERRHPRDGAAFGREMIEIITRVFNGNRGSNANDYPPGLIDIETAIQAAVEAKQSASNNHFHIDSLRPLADWLIANGAPKHVLLGHQIIVESGTEAERIDASRQIFRIAFTNDHNMTDPPDTAGPELSRVIERAAAVLDHHGELHPWLDAQLAKAEANRNPAPLLRMPSALSTLLYQMDQSDGGTRLLRLAELVRSASPDQALFGFHKAFLDSARLNLERLDIERQSVRTKDVWTRYAVQRFRLEPQDSNAKLLLGAVLDRDAAPERQLVIAWAGNVQMLEDDVMSCDVLVTRSHLTGGKYEVAGRGELVVRDWVASRQLYVDMAVAGEYILLTSERGLAVVADGQMTIYGEEQGCPNPRLMQVDAIGNLAVTGHINTLATFDLTERRFRVLASARSVTEKNKLDGKVPFRVQSIKADRKVDRFVMSVYSDREPQLRGVWVYSPETDKLVQAQPTGIWDLQAYLGEPVIYGTQGKAIFVLNRAGNQLMPFELPQMKMWKFGLHATQGLTFGDDLVAFYLNDLAIFTADGGIYPQPNGSRFFDWRDQTAQIGIFAFTRVPQGYTHIFTIQPKSGNNSK